MINLPLKITPCIVTCTLNNGKGACNGDSGGPLAYLQDGVWYHYGIVSFGNIECEAEGSPSAFTRVTSHLDWILENTNDEIIADVNNCDGVCQCTDTGTDSSDQGAFGSKNYVPVFMKDIVGLYELD